MWSFATHAGAGMAIAGLTATYYALSRRNYQGERERMPHESGFGDGPQVNRLRKHNDNVRLSSSHMLLKKEMEELSLLHGTGSGLNILYQQKNPLHHFHRSNFEITPIVSRVDTRPSEDEIGTSADGGDGESVFGIESNLEEKSDLGPDNNTASDELPIKSIDMENMPAMNISKSGGGDAIDDTIEIVEKDEPIQNANSIENEEENISTADKKQKSASDKWKSVQENQFLQKTQSPICFFKNPGFGNRYAVTAKKKKTTSLVATLSSSNIHATSKSNEEENRSPDSCENVPLSPSDNRQKNSTHFILSPEISKSNTSVCEAENPEKMLKRRKKLLPETKTVIETHPVEEMSEYNKTLRKKMIANNAGNEMGAQPLIRLRVDPDISHLRFPKRASKPVHQPSPKDLTSEPKDDSGNHTKHKEEQKKAEKIYEKVDATVTSDSNDNDLFEKPIFPELADDGMDEPSDISCQRPVYKVGTTNMRRSSTVNEIPSNSWISLPVRIYTNSMSTLPWPLIGFCMLVVIVAGIFGIFLTRLADSINRRYQEENSS